MNKKVLVTTALEETWPVSDQPILFLGEWCRLYSRKSFWMNLDSEILQYPWDDRNLLFTDYKYLIDLYETLLIELTIELNKIHKVNRKSEYWRILIGPWLMAFVAIVFERWTCLEKAFSEYEIKKTVIIKDDYLLNIPLDMEHFSSLQEEDYWNHHIYSHILRALNFTGINEIEKIKKDTDNIYLKSKVYREIRKKLKSFISRLSMLFQSDNNFFIIKTYLSSLDFLKLNIKLSQFPVLYISERIDDHKALKKFREWSLPETNPDNKFVQILKDLIPMQMPKCYLEGYKDLRERPSKLGWPKKPRLIWTSNSFHLDDVFKQWVAEKSNEDILFVIGQHGGNYGQALFSFTEYHELKISNYYLSWGWTSSNKQVIPLGILKKKVIKKRNQSIKRLLLIISSYPRYSGSLLSMPISKQVLDYFEDQKKFFSNLPSSIAKDTVVRLYPHDYSWFQKDRWAKSFPESSIDNCDEDFNTALSNSRIVISGWNTTTYLESLAADIPTVIFWDSKYFELKDEAKEYFEQLEKVKIFHKNPHSAANHVQNIWENIDEWWNKSEVVEARDNFKRKYVFSDNRPLDKLAEVFKAF